MGTICSFGWIQKLWRTTNFYKESLYCAICHGAKGDGQGWLVKQEKILGIPSYADPARNITVGTTYHVQQYGLNAMGSYASQMNNREMWQVSEYVMKLKQDLSK